MLDVRPTVAEPVLTLAADIGVGRLRLAAVLAAADTLVASVAGVMPAASAGAVTAAGADTANG
jgi:hypothetical protein